MLDGIVLVYVVNVDRHGPCVFRGHDAVEKRHFTVVMSAVVSWVLNVIAANDESYTFDFCFFGSYFGNDTHVVLAAACWQGLMADKVQDFGSLSSARGISVGEAADFVGSGLIQTTASGPERSCSYSRESLVTVSITASAQGGNSPMAVTRCAMLSAASGCADENGCCMGGAWWWRHFY